MSKISTVALLIPSLAPDQKLCKVVNDGIAAGFVRILIVDDGSSEESLPFFTEAEKLGAKVIHHAVNLGKGRALKTGINFILSEWKECTGVVTVDSDGQHRMEDVQKCLHCVKKNESALVLGCRNFSGKNVPFRSRFGNQVTAKVMKLLLGVSISDTQTGLRAFSKELMKAFVSVKGERFDYEMNMLLLAREKDIPIIEVPIDTVYIEENRSSHFRPLRDSVMIYSLFLKYILTSLSSFLIDILLFTVFVFLLRPLAERSYIIQATFFARVFSSVFNFLVNRNGVFKSNEKLKPTLIRYYFLALIQMGASAFLTQLFHWLTSGNESLLKIVVDTILFFLSYSIQREWVFRATKGKKERK